MLRIALFAALLAAVVATLPADHDQRDRDLFSTSYTCKGSTLPPGGILRPNEYICAYDPDDGSKIRFGLNFIGILLFYRDSKVIWSSKKRGDYLVFQKEDSHLVLYGQGNRVAWSTQCFGRGRGKAVELNFGGGTKPGLLLIDEKEDDVWFLGTDGSLSGCYPDPKILLTPTPVKAPTKKIFPGKTTVDLIDKIKPDEVDDDDGVSVDIDCSKLKGRVVLSTNPRVLMKFSVKTPRHHRNYNFSPEERAAGGFLTVQLMYEGEGYVALATSKDGKMPDSEAIICQPDKNRVAKFLLMKRSMGGIIPLNSKTLADTFVSQEGGVTRCGFTKLLNELQEIPIDPIGSNTFNWAVGDSNRLSYHKDRGSIEISFAKCPVPDEVVQTAKPTKMPTKKPTKAPTDKPTNKPTRRPTLARKKPTRRPTARPTRNPTPVPPTRAPPTARPPTPRPPTEKPTEKPTKTPTNAPTVEEVYVEPDVVNNHPGLTSFFVMGDAPYNDREMTHWVPRQMERIAYDSDFVFHVGNQMLPAASKCNIMWNKFMKDTALSKSPSPVFITPGENDYVQCKGRIEDSENDVEQAWQNWKDVYLKLDKLWPHDLPVVYQKGRQENFSFLLRRTLIVSFHMINGPPLDVNEWKARHFSNYEFVKDRLDHHKGNYDVVVLLSHAKPSEDHMDFFNRLTFTVVTDSVLKRMPFVYIHGGGMRQGVYEEEERFLNLKNFLRIQIEGRKRNPINVMIDTTSSSPVKIDRNDKSVWSVCCNAWLEGWPAHQL